MAVNQQDNLEQALARTEADADAACKSATTVLRTLKKYRAAAQTGNLRELPKLIEAAGEAITELQQQLAQAKTAWDFDETRIYQTARLSQNYWRPLNKPG